MIRIKKHFVEKKNYYILSAVIILLFTMLYAFVGIFPFGNRTIAHYDMYSQICTFVGLIFDAFGDKSTLVFSNFLSGGANVLGYITYFIFSPFYLLLLPFGKGGIIYAINIVVILQVLAIGIVFMWFIRRYFRLSCTWQILFALIYTFSPYVLFDYTWFSWLYIYMLMPIFAHTFIELLKHGKICGFTFVVTSMIYACYGVGLFSQVVLFVLAIVFIFLMIRDNEKRRISISKLLMAYGMAVALSLPLLATSFAQLLEGSRLGNITDDILHKSLICNSIWHWVMFLMSDICSLIFSIIYVVKCDKRKPFSKFLLVALLLNVAPILFDGILLVLSMGSYYGYVTRMGYILTFFMLISAMLYLRSAEREHVPNSTLIKDKWVSISMVVVPVLGVVCFSMAIYSKMSDCLGNAFIPFEVCFLYTVIPLLIGFGAIFLTNRYNDKKLGKGLYRALILCLCVTQVAVNLPLFTGESLEAKYPVMFLKEQSSKLGEEYEYRLKDMMGSLSYNDQIFCGFSSISGFSSSINGLAVDTMDSLGYFTLGNIIGSFGGTVLSDSFLGYKYYYSQYSLDCPWLSLVEQREIDGANYYLYENTLALENALLIDKNRTLNLSCDIMSNTQSLFEYLGGSGQVFRCTETYTLAEEKTMSSSVADSITYSLMDTSMGVIDLAINSSDYNKVLYAVVNVDSGESVICDFGDFGYAPNVLCKNTFVHLGYVAKDGGELNATMLINNQSEIKEVTIYELNYDMVEGLLKSLQEDAVKMEYTANGFVGETTAENQKLVVTNININGYNLFLNGRTVEPTDCGFIEIDLDDGENKVVAEYEYPYKTILVISLVLGALVFAILSLAYWWLSRSKKLCNLFYVAGIGLFVAFLGVVYFLPSLIFVVRLCLFKF